MRVGINLEGGRHIEFEDIYNDVLQETQYHVYWDKTNVFLMAPDPEFWQLKIQGPAPYDAREIEDKLDAVIDWYNNGFNSLLKE